MKGSGAQVSRVRDFVVRDALLSLWVQFGAVGPVLLIACANVAITGPSSATFCIRGPFLSIDSIVFGLAPAPSVIRAGICETLEEGSSAAGDCRQPALGFPAEGVLTASITLPALKYPNPEQRIGF